MTPLQTIDKALHDAAYLKFAERMAGQPHFTAAEVWSDDATLRVWLTSQEFRDYRMAYRDIANKETGRS